MGNPVVGPGEKKKAFKNILSQIMDLSRAMSEKDCTDLNGITAFHCAGEM